MELPSSRGVAKDGMVFVAHPVPNRITKLELKKILTYPILGLGELPGDIALPRGILISEPARKLVENTQASVGQTTRQRAGIKAIKDEIGKLARHKVQGLHKRHYEVLMFLHQSLTSELSKFSEFD